MMTVKDLAIKWMGFNLPVPSYARSLVYDVLRTIKVNNVTLKVSTGDSIDYLGEPAYGFFSQHPLTFGIAGGVPVEDWLPVMVHESCHMDQWLEHSPYWVDGHILGIEAVDIMTLWVDGHIDLTCEQRQNIVKKSRDIELDCERRTVEKFKKYKLPINIDQYIKRANSYIYSYTISGWLRAFNDPGRTPYDIPEVWQKMPATFDVDHSVITPEIYEAFTLVFPQLKCKPGDDCYVQPLYDCGNGLAI